jgi:hypothetical protein
MSLRVGAVLVVTGLTLAMLFGSLFVVAGGLMSVCGGILLAIGIEPALAERTVEPDTSVQPADAEHGDVAA